MWNWWAKKKALNGQSKSEEAGEQPSAADVETEYSGYVSRVRKTMLHNVCVAVVATLMIYLGARFSEYNAASRSLQHAADSASIYLAPLPAAMTLGGFSLLAAVAIGLQLAVRTPSTAESTPATAIARRRFLCELAQIIVLASFALAAYTTVPAFSSAPEVVDVVRLFGPGICATLVALIAADAGVAADPDFAPREISRVSRARTAVLLLAGIRMVGSRRSDAPRSPLVRQAAAMVLGPVIVGLASSLAINDVTPWQRSLLVIVAMITALVAYAIAVCLYLRVVRRDWVGAALIIGTTVALSLLCWLMMASLMLTQSSSSRSLTPAAATEAWAVVYVAVPAFLAAWTLTPSRHGEPRVLGLVVGRALARRLKKRHDGLEGQESHGLNRLAAVSPWISPLVPFGLLLAIIAKQQIRRANMAPARNPQRGTGFANAAIILTAAFFVIIITGLFVVAAVDLPEWNDYMWGD